MKRYNQTMVVGGLLLAVSLSAAWSVGRGGVEVERAPLDRILEVEAPLAAGFVEPSSWDLPATKNSSVERWADFLSGRNADNTKVWLERKGRYGPMIRAELRRRGMPEDLLYLALIESGLSPKAYSRAAASGMWQFIAETGKRYGLEVSSEVDERRDPVKSTSAALDYLEDLYARFGSWYLAAAAYNTGENRVERILRERAGGEKGDDALFWKIAPHLPRETRDYVPLMLAAGFIGKDPGAYGFDALEYQEPLAFDVVWVPGATELATIAEASGVDVEDVKELNPHLLKAHTPANRGWSVRIPAGTRVAFEQAFPTLYREARLAAVEEAPKPAPAKATARFHSVKRGENLTVIARRYGITLTQIRKWNDIRGSRILPGQRLRVSA